MNNLMNKYCGEITNNFLNRDWGEKVKNLMNKCLDKIKNNFMNGYSTMEKSRTIMNRYWGTVVTKETIL